MRPKIAIMLLVVLITSLFLMSGLVLCGCATQKGIPTVTNPYGILNFTNVEEGVWRGGQPTTSEQWQWLKTNCVIKWDVKLNPTFEGSDKLAESNGMNVTTLPIFFGQFIYIPHTTNQLNAAVAAIVEHKQEGVYIHCSHGQDRTGLAIGAYRVEAEHWSKDAAWQEMTNHGFHPLLIGLYQSWQEDVRIKTNFP